MIDIVEDDHSVADSLQLFLQSMGFDVRVFHDAERYLLGSRAGVAADVVIIDLGLPGMDGGDLIRSLICGEDPPRVICISGQTQAFIDATLCGIPSPFVLRKPLSIERLSALL